MLAGFEQPTSGEIEIDGQSMVGVPAYDRPTNMVFQSYAIFPHLNVAENIAYGLRRLRLTRAETAHRVEGALAMIKMDGYGGRAAHQLSGGQRQRVALARALVCQPKVLLLDEPLGALDKKLREEMQLELRQLQRSVGITFVFVTHDQEEALTLSDRIAVMSRGKTLQIDTASRLYEQPNCREVAEFIGSMNMFNGIVERVDDGRATVNAGPLGRLEARLHAAGIAAGHHVAVAVRPEKIALAWDDPKSSVNSIQGRLGAKAYFGDRSHYFVEAVGAERPVAVAHQNRNSSFGESDSIGRPVWITFPAESAVVLTH
jgi:ABC-type Fe3+/spermidine/putrescine transport system ATPase subunit